LSFRMVFFINHLTLIQPGFPVIRYRIWPLQLRNSGREQIFLGVSSLE
jgi:hypothetical protein